MGESAIASDSLSLNSSRDALPPGGCGGGVGGSGGGDGGSGGSSHASATTAAWKPDGTSPGVGGGGCTGGGRGSSPYESAVSATASASLSAGAASEQSISASGPRSAASLLLFLRPPGISKHTDEYGSIFNFESSTRSDQGSEFRIACCMQARSISAP